MNLLGIIWLHCAIMPVMADRCVCVCVIVYSLTYTAVYCVNYAQCNSYICTVHIVFIMNTMEAVCFDFLYSFVVMLMVRTRSLQCVNLNDSCFSNVFISRTLITLRVYGTKWKRLVPFVHSRVMGVLEIKTFEKQL